MSLTRNTDHAAQMVELLLEQFKRRVNWEALLNAWAVSIQDVENMLYDLFSKRSIDTAVGEQLDILGVIVGVARESRTDVVYRVRLKVQIRINVSCGTPDDILSVIGLLSNLTIDYRDSYPAAFVVELDGAMGTEEEADEIAAVVSKTRSGGVNGQVISNVDAEDHVFRLADGTTSDADAARGLLNYSDTWTAAASATGAWTFVVRAPERGIFVAGASDGSIATSSDGQTWTPRTAPASVWVDGAWSPSLGLFVVVDNGDASPIASSDGITWSTIPSMASIGGSWCSIKWSAFHRSFLASTRSGSPLMARSSNGISWTSSVQPTNDMPRIAVDDLVGRFVGIDEDVLGQFWVSDDMVNWTVSNAPLARTYEVICHSPSLGLFCALSQSGAALGSVATSVDGATWTSQTGTYASANWSGVVDADGVLVAVSRYGTTAQQIMYSIDAGVTWNALTSPNAQQWATLCYASDLGIACALSDDGVYATGVMLGTFTGGHLAAVRIS